jgi:hypothetical protein
MTTANELYAQSDATPPPPPPTSNTPLDNLAAEIKELYERELEIGDDEREALQERHQRECDELEASLEPQLLIEARKLVPARSWEKWCRNLSISLSNIRACIALAEAEDPVAAHEVEKAKVRERVAKHRQSAKSAVTGDDVTAESPSAPVTLPDAVARDALAPDPESEPLPEPSSPSPPERSLAAQLAACPEWRMLTRPITKEEMSLEYHSVIATLGKIHEPIERRLIERWINAHWQPEAVAAD